MFRVVITGARDLPEPEIVWLPLWSLLHRHRAIIVCHGDAESGADLFAHQWFELPGQAFNRQRLPNEPPVEYLAIEDRHPPDWTKGDYALKIRNQDMINENPNAVFSFPTPSSQGTLDCVARAWVRGIPVYVWHYLNLGQWRLMTDDEGERLARRKLAWGKVSR